MDSRSISRPWPAGRERIEWDVSDGNLMPERIPLDEPVRIPAVFFNGAESEGLAAFRADAVIGMAGQVVAAMDAEGLFSQLDNLLGRLNGLCGWQDDRDKDQLPPSHEDRHEQRHPQWQEDQYNDQNNGRQKVNAAPAHQANRFSEARQIPSHILRIPRTQIRRGPKTRRRHAIDQRNTGLIKWVFHPVADCIEIKGLIPDSNDQ